MVILCSFIKQFNNLKKNNMSALSFGLFYAIFTLMWAVYVLIITDSSCMKNRKGK